MGQESTPKSCLSSCPLSNLAQKLLALPIEGRAQDQEVRGKLGPEMS